MEALLVHINITRSADEQVLRSRELPVLHPVRVVPQRTGGDPGEGHCSLPDDLVPPSQRVSIAAIGDKEGDRSIVNYSDL